MNRAKILDVFTGVIRFGVGTTKSNLMGSAWKMTRFLPNNSLGVVYYRMLQTRIELPPLLNGQDEPNLSILDVKHPNGGGWMNLCIR